MLEGAMKVERFEDLFAWQEARALTRDIYRTTRTTGWTHDFRLAGQMREASVSVMANIAEGFERHSAREFHQFLCIAKASCAEVRSHLYVALDAGLLERGDFERLMRTAESVSRITGALRVAVARVRT
jgi:four helix bundle protein